MKKRLGIVFGFMPAVLALASDACLDAQAAPEKAKLPPATSDELGGSDRFLPTVSTDKPIYRIGENVYVRVVVLDARTRKPFAASNLWGNAEIIGPKGDTVATGVMNGELAVLSFSWRIPEGTAGGQYTVRTGFPSWGFPPAERKFDIRVFRAPRLKSQILFLRDGYGPGDRVTATLHTERAEGGIPVKAKVIVTARVDDNEVHRDTVRVDDHGNATASFDLPKSIARGEGTLAMAIEDGGVVETATKTIPILLQTLDLVMYPEGGDLVYGLPARVYVEARTPAQKPADFEAVIVDQNDEIAAEFKTEHEGRGRFTFTPQSNRSYRLKIVKPSGIVKAFTLPLPKADGAVLTTTNDVIAKDAPARFKVGATKAEPITLTISQREVPIATTKLEFGKSGWFSRKPKVGQLNDVTVPLAEEIDGVLIATLWNADGEPLAERLIFRQPAKEVKVTVKADRPSYVPGSTAKLEITTTDDKGKPVAAVVGMTVTDESVLEMVEKREQAPRLPVMVFLENDVKELADAHVYLDPQNPKAPLATDLLLGTQGWRRFALVHITQFLREHGDQARRALAVKVTPRPVAPSEDDGAMLREEEAVPAMAAPPQAMVKAAPAMPPVPMAVNGEERAAPPAPPMQPVVQAQPEAKQQRPMEQDADKARKKEDVRAAVAAGALARKDARLMGKAALADEVVENEPAGAQSFIFVREYSHTVRPDRNPTDRVDFAETLYWHAAVATAPATGKAEVTFGLSDSVTAFRVMADAFTGNGALGTATEAIKSTEPFYLEPKVPLQVSSGDRIDLPVALVNGTTADLNDVSMLATASKGIEVSAGAAKLGIKAGGRSRRIVGLATGSYIGTSPVVVEGKAGNYTDKVTRNLDVRPIGFPAEVAQGGMLEPKSTQTLAIEIPQEMVAGSVTTEIGVFPTPLGNLTQALTRLMQEPNGCFEQTSSSNYPLTMAQQYFTTHQGVDPTLVQKSQELLSQGYQRLTSFECKNKGYEWFGGASPGHEALTAYGLMEFADMSRAKLRMVDQTMVERTRAWLFKRKDGKGGFLRNPEALDSFGGAPEPTTNAYIVWALVSAGEKGLEKEIDVIKKAANSSQDSYIVALAADIAAMSGDAATAKSLMQKLAAKQDKTGFVAGAATSITQSGGEALTIETTALATLAWLKQDAFAGEVEKAMHFLNSQCEGGRFSSTQSTVLALKAIVAYDAARSRPKAGGSVQVLVDGSAVGAAVAFTAQTQGALVLPSIAERLGPGKHSVQLKMNDGARMPFTVAVRYNTLKPLSAEATKLRMTTTLRDAKIKEGDVTEMRVDVQNATDADVPMPVAIIGVPGGLEVRHDQLKELVKSGKIDAYEVLGRQVVLYWRQLKAKKSVSLPLSVVAAIPGRYTAPASRVYEYYTDENKWWVAGATAEITPLSMQ